MKYQDFSFLLKVVSSPRTVKILFLSFTCEDIGVAMVTNMISQLQESFPLMRVVFYVKFHQYLKNKQNILHCRLGIRILSSRAENISHD